MSLPVILLLIPCYLFFFYLFACKIMQQYLNIEVEKDMHLISDAYTLRLALECWNTYKLNWSLNPKYQLKLFKYLEAFDKFKKTKSVTATMLQY